MKYDVAIIGAGPGGYVAAIKCAQLGAKVLLIEKGEIGGVCLNKGCIPTKALIASAHIIEKIASAADYGVIVDSKPIIDMKVVQDRKRDIVSKLKAGVTALLKGNKIDVLQGDASFSSNGELHVSGNAVDADKVLIATGSKWIDLPTVKVDGERIVTTDTALDWEVIPKKLAIVGGGVVGCEFACMMNSFGVEVTIIEAMPSILPMIEKSISRLLDKQMKANGISILANSKLESAKIEGNSVKLGISEGKSLEVDKVLVAVGRRVSTEELNPTVAGIKTNGKGFIDIDENYQTNNENIYAIGDVVGGYMLAHEASAEGVAVAEHIFGDKKNISIGPIPKPIFTSPEIASVGKSSEELKTEGAEFKTGRFPFLASGKALCDGAVEGQVVVHADSEGKVLGLHIFGEGSTTLIAEATLAMKMGCTVRELEVTVHAHPTLSETVAEAAGDVYSRAIHKLGRK